MKSRPGRALAGVGFGVLLLLAAEVVLRTIGFQYDKSLSYMEFNFPRPHELHQIFEPDPVLLWRLRPNYDFGQGFPRLNPQGFRGVDFASLPPSAFRIACLGDSVTFGRPEADFTTILRQKLDTAVHPAQVLNFGVPGYSSFQGRLLLDRVLRDYRPAFVIILFGWNDHWLAKGFPDAEQRATASSAADWLGPLRKLRLYQFVNHARAHLVGDARRPAPGPDRLRVSPEDYRENLVAMIEACRKSGVAVIVATAPSGIASGKVPDYLATLDFIRDPSELAPLHARYNEVARAAARQSGATLCDLDAAFGQRETVELFDDPGQDLIHPNAAGYELMADKLAECVKKTRTHD